ncbi:MAG: protoporphyrinogen oxidase HemJ [Sphingobacteriia bacterium]|nr:protoporphyrinogen oxidase HemJ [Sphingobacteriia bacterium]
MTEYYLVIKSLHIISMVAWMAGLFYLPRLYVYHTRTEQNSELDLTLKVMEKKLLRIIINPAMIFTFIFGLMLIHILGFKNLGIWFHIKFLLVILLSGFHGMLAKWRKDFEKGQNKHSEKFYRIANEFPTVMLVLIVFLVVLKPF